MAHFCKPQFFRENKEIDRQRAHSPWSLRHWSWIRRFETRYGTSQKHLHFCNRSLVYINMSTMFRWYKQTYILFTCWYILGIQFMFRVDPALTLSRSSKLRGHLSWKSRAKQLPGDVGCVPATFQSPTTAAFSCFPVENYQQSNLFEASSASSDLVRTWLARTYLSYFSSISRILWRCESMSLSFFWSLRVSLWFSLARFLRSSGLGWTKQKREGWKAPAKQGVTTSHTNRNKT